MSAVLGHPQRKPDSGLCWSCATKKKKKVQQFIPDAVFIRHCQRIYLCERLSQFKNMCVLVTCAPAQYKVADCFSMTAAV